MGWGHGLGPRRDDRPRLVTPAVPAYRVPPLLNCGLVPGIRASGHQGAELEDSRRITRWRALRTSIEQALPRVSEHAFGGANAVRAPRQLSGQTDDDGRGIAQHDARRDGGPARRRRPLQAEAVEQAEDSPKEAFDTGALAQLVGGPGGRETTSGASSGSAPGSVQADSAEGEARLSTRGASLLSPLLARKRVVRRVGCAHSRARGLPAQGRRPDRPLTTDPRAAIMSGRQTSR
jgi:hypothetical protein